MHQPLRIALLVAAFAATACSTTEEARPPRAPDARPEGARRAPPRAAVDDENRAQLSIDPRISDACGISAAYFDFDSSAIRGEIAGVLDAVAECLTTGPLAGRALRLVGHADPRGETTYNFGLGQRRAGNVADYLQQRGVPNERLTTSSRGEIDATGVDERSWQLDRKVEVLLAD
jgi:peptidoglycan-associated lipoprotein